MRFWALILLMLLTSSASFADVPVKTSPVKTLGIVVFPNFELLDVFGPLEMFGQLQNKIRIVVIAEKQGPVKSEQGPTILADTDLQHAPHVDLLLVPGGFGTRQAVHDTTLISWLQQRSKTTDLTLSVCTGAALLSQAGILNHHKATTNKMAFNWVAKQNSEVNWIKSARWVDDGHVVTSSGIAAGIDMSLHVIARLYGTETSNKIASGTEYFWNRDPNHDPFSKNIQG